MSIIIFSFSHSGNALPAWSIALIVLGALLVIAAVAAAVVIFMKKQKSSEEEQGNAYNLMRVDA